MSTRSDRLRGWRVDGAILRKASVIAAVALAPALIGALLFGPGAAIGVVFGLSIGVGAGMLCGVPATVAITLVSIAAAVLGDLAVGSPIAGAAIVGLAGLSVGPANRLGIGRTALTAPVVAAVMASGALPLPATQVVAGLALGVAWTFVLVRRLLPRQTPVPSAVSTAWVHAIALALTCGAATYVSMAAPLDHGYWVVVTLAAVLQPAAADSERATVERILGTLLGAFIGIAVGLLVPTWLAGAAVFGSALLFVAYSLLRDRIRGIAMQTVLLILVLTAPGSGATVDVALTRLAWTLVGAGIVVVVGLGVAALGRTTDARDAASHRHLVAGDRA